MAYKFANLGKAPESLLSTADIYIVLKFLRCTKFTNDITGLIAGLILEIWSLFQCKSLNFNLFNSLYFQRNFYILLVVNPGANILRYQSRDSYAVIIQEFLLRFLEGKLQ